MGLYKVIFLGMAVAGPEEEVRLIRGLQKKFNLTPERAESLLQRVPIVVRKGVPQEEMERYVKAFEEIGGRVKVEEVSASGPLEISEPFESRKKPYMGRMITCPQCGFEQPETDECIKCGIIISKHRQYEEEARLYEGKVREISSEEKYSSWEGGDGFISAFLKTTREVLFSPTLFFQRAATGEGYWSPLIYGVISGIIGLGVTFFWIWLLIAQIVPIQRFLPFEHSTSILRVILPLPFQLALSILIGSGITHLCLIIVGGNKNGFQTTFRVISYSFGGYLLGIIPVVGTPIGGMYALILTITGLREGHEISTGRAILAVFLPTILGIVLGIAGVFLLSLFFGSMKFFGGVGV